MRKKASYMRWRAAAFAAVALLFASGASASVTVTEAPASVANGHIGDVVALVSSASEPTSVRLCFSLSGATDAAEGYEGNFIEMSPTGTQGEYRGFIPILPAGTLNWSVTAEFADGTTEQSSGQTTVISGETGYDYFHDMKGIAGISAASGDYYDAAYGWVQDTATYGGGTTNFYAETPAGDSRWVAHGVSWAYSAGRSTHVPNPNAGTRNIAVISTLNEPVLYFWNILPEEPSYIRTPKLPHGIGSFSFTALNVANVASELEVQALRSDDPDSGEWATIGTYSLPATAGTLWPVTNIINDASVRYVRIARMSVNSGANVATGVISIDDIQATPPTSRLNLHRGAVSPAEPVTGQGISLQCLASNVTASIPAFNRSATVFYSFENADSGVVSSWSSMPMSYAGETNGCAIFECELPGQPAPGTLRYYYKSDFDGYYFTSKSKDAVPSPVYLYSAASTTNAPSSSQYFTLNVSARVYKIHIESAPETLNSGYTGMVTATDDTGNAPASVKLWFSLSGSDSLAEGWHSVDMAIDAESGKYTGVIPVLPEGTLSWYVEATYADGSTEPSTLHTTEISGDLDYGRFHDMKGITGISSASGNYYDGIYGWVQDSSKPSYVDGTAHYNNFYAVAPNGTKWLAHGVGWAYSATRAQHVPNSIATIRNISGLIPGMTVPIMYFWNTGDNPYIQSPVLEGGAGVFSFDARTRSDTSVTLQVQKTYIDNPDDSYPSDDWEDVGSGFSFSGDATHLGNKVAVNDLLARRIRIVRTDYAEDQNPEVVVVSIDNIRITPASPDIEMKEVLRHPGYPAIDQEITLRCAVSNISETTPFYNMALTNKFALADYASSTVTKWTSVGMDFVCETNGWLLYECTLPAQGKPGWLHYCFEATFDGYCYSSREENCWNSPKYLYTGSSTTNAPALYPPHLNFEVRQFKSRYSKMNIMKVADNGGLETGSMALVGDDLWQATLPVDAGTSPKVYFYGLGAYTDNAESFIASPFYYGDNDQDEPYETPTGGRPERLYASTNGLKRIQINASSDGYLIYWLQDSTSDNSLNYTVKRGVYQDFDDWEVDGDYYTKTFYGSAIGVNADDFDSWVSPTRHSETETKTENFLSEDFLGGKTIYPDVPPGSAEFIEDTTYNAWKLSGVRLTSERITNATSTVTHPVSGLTPFTNTTAHVKTDGYIYNTDSSNYAVGISAIPSGLGRISAMARVVIADNAMAIYNGQSWKYGADDNNAMFVEASFNIPLDSRPNSHYYASVIFDWTDENNYRELRFVRADSNNGANDYSYRIELWRCCAGTSSRYGVSGVPSRASVKTDTTVVVKLRNRFDGTRVRTSYQVTLGSQTDWNNYGASATDNLSPAMTDAGNNGGKIGFCAYDCAPVLNYIKAYRKNGGTDTENFGAGGTASVSAGNVASSFSDVSASWSFGGVDDTCSGTEAQYKWFIDTGSGGVLRRRIPSVTLEIAATDYTGGDPTWGSVLASPVLDSPLFTKLTVDVHAWQKKQVRFKVTSAAGNYAAFDSISLTPWRAATRDSAAQYGFYDGVQSDEWDSPSTQTDWADDGNRDDRWLIFEGWAITNTISMNTVAAAFEPSQNNPDLIQGLVSPIMTNGIGTVRFDYTVASDGAAAGSKVVYALEYTDSSSTTVFGTLVETFTNYVGETGFHSKDISVNYREGEDDDPDEMRLRIRILRDESDEDAILFLDNVFINDFPPENEDMWKVYNGRIPPASSEPARVYGGAGKSLFLNNSPDDGIPPRTESTFSAWAPYLQAPRMDEGVGEVSFMYRAYGDTAGLIRISVSPSETFDASSWTELTNIVVSGTGYVKFDDPSIYRTSSRFVRISSETNGYGRVCIDNVMVAEPSRPSFKISTVTLSPSSPTAGSDLVAVNAQLTRFMQSPTNIHIYVSFNTSTNTWGYTNWWSGTKFDTSSRLELFDDGTGTNYTTAAGSGLPAEKARDIVQYIVWGVHREVSPDYPIDEVYFQEKSCFTPPSSGTDYNQLIGDYSPYYFVLSCEPGAVWFNEIWHAYNRSETYPDGGTAYEFIELAGKSGVDISGWKILGYTSQTHYNKGNADFTCEIPDGTVLRGSGGWGFWVVGDTGTPNVNCIGVNGSGNPGVAGDRDIFSGSSYAFELIRGDSGDVEQAVYIKSSAGDTYPLGGASTYISSPSKSRNLVASHGFSYSLLDERNGNLAGYDSTKNTSYTNSVAGTGGNPRVWYWTLGTPTPGEANRFEESISQTISSGGTTVYSIISTIASGYGHGTHNGDGAEAITIEVEGGGASSVVYVAGDWYKIVSLTENGTEVAAAAGTSSYTWEVPSASGNVALNVSFGPKTSADDSRWTDAILDWFRANGWSESEIETGDGDEWSVAQEYLLGTDPTVDTSVDCSTTSISLSGNDVSMGLGLVREENGTPVVSPVNGAVNIYGMAELGGAETLIGPASIQQGAFDNAEEESVTFSTEGLGLNFFIWRIE